MWRRRSPSVMIPTSRPSRRRRRRSRAASWSSRGPRRRGWRSGATRGRSSPLCISCSTRSSWLPSLPPGWNTAKSRAEKPRRSSSATASASPSASMQVVEVVGARPIGQASPTSGSSRHEVGRLGQRARRPADHADQRDREPPRVEDQVAQLGGLAGVRQRQHRVLRRDHAEVAVAGLGRMDVERRRAGRGQGRGDLARDVAALAHAGDHDAAGDAGQQLDGRGERAVDRRRERRAAPPPRPGSPGGRCAIAASGRRLAPAVAIGRLARGDAG